MPEISLTDFVDVVIKSGTPKATKVEQIKHRPSYEPAFDFYKYVREKIKEIHRTNGSKKELDHVLPEIRNQKKLPSYSQIVEGYRRWWGRKDFRWFDPPSTLFSKHGIDVRINPELGLIVNGKSHLIKLYFKSSEVTKNRINIITHLMTESLTEQTPTDTIMAVLDVRNGKLFTPPAPVAKLSAILEAEMAYIAALWPQI